MTDALPTIFVSIASYRDPECQFTVRDLFAKAAHPERIRVGICWQYNPDLDRDCFILESPYPEQTRTLRFLAWESKGGTWARATALSLVQDEDYILQIDAHMRFAPGWDDIMIETLSRCPARKAALTTCPPPYTPADNLEKMDGCISVSITLNVSGMKQLQPIGIGGNKRPWKYVSVHGGPIPTPFVTANFLFGRRQMFEEVPYDPHLFFRGQESTYSLRLWTHGYNLFHPDKTVIYHYWDAKIRRDGNDTAGNYKEESANAERACARVWHILGLKPAENPESLIEIERYGLGNIRTPEAFWQYAGVNLQTCEMTEDARRGNWPLLPSL